MRELTSVLMKLIDAFSASMRALSTHVWALTLRSIPLVPHVHQDDCP
jgi:hypothetical protein